MHSRIDKINELIREKLSKIIYDFDPSSFVSISGVNTTRDFLFCDVTIMVIMDRISTVDRLNKKAFQIQKIIAHDINMRQTPKIRFHLDQSEAYAENIDKILSSSRRAPPKHCG